MTEIDQDETTKPRTGVRGWWHGLRPLTRRAIRVTVAFATIVLISAGFGISTATYTGNFGPHVAEYNTRLNGEIRVDMGPLGALVIPSPLPANLGVDVHVREIPDQLAASGQDPIEGLTADLNSYSQFFANPQATIDDAARGLINDALGRTVVTVCVLMSLIALGRLAAHGVLRDAVKSAWRQPGVPIVAPAMAAVLVILPLTDLTRTFGPEGRSSPVLAGTPLEDARVTGRLATIIDHYGGMVLEAVEDNNRFYADVADNLTAAYEADLLPEAPPAEPPGLLNPPIDIGPQTGTDSDGTDPGGSGDEATDPNGPTDPSTPEPEREGSGARLPVLDVPYSDPDAEYATFLVVSDLHCNIGMAPVINTAAQMSGADAVLNAGDTVVSGTSVESACVNAFADGIDAGIPVVVADGNHDSILTGEQERARGWTVLDGGIVEVAGVRILGDADPTLTEIGTGTRPERDETSTEMGERLARTACEVNETEDRADILLLHSPHPARFALNEGCVPLNISGHMHTQQDPYQRGLGIQFITGSTAGAALGRPTVGPLQSQAVMTVVRWNVTDREPGHYRVITADPDGSVDLGDWTDFPPQPTEFVDISQEPGAGTDPEGTDPDGTDPDGTDPDGTDPDDTDPGTDDGDIEEGDPGTPDQNLPEDEQALQDDE